jgi:pimeloyl-ACP methyl ester carboxylesterase
VIKAVRRFVEVEGRRVHYRQMGNGPPAVFLHASPANSEMVLPEMAVAAPHFTCFAFDTPGFGDSDPLPGTALEVSDLARATGAAMAAIGLPPCPVFGTHTGSAIAIELGMGWPERVTGLVLDAIPLFTEEEMARIFQDFFVAFEADPLGGHFTQVWIRFRDQFTWFPWKSRDVTRLNAVDRPTPEEIQHWVMMYYHARKTYIPAYRAACYYGSKGIRAAQALTVPAVYMATEEDMLFGHLDRLPPLKKNQRIVRLAPDTAAKHQAILGFLRDLPTSQAKTVAPAKAFAGYDPAVQFIDTGDGQIFVRCYGDASKRAVLLLHDAPGTGLALADMARELSEKMYVILPDLPGTGDSNAPGDDKSVLDAAASALSIIADTLGLKQFSVAGVGVGATLAAVFAGKNDSRLTALLLEDVPVKDEAAAGKIAPDMPLTPEGSHWIQAWLMLRDAQIYKPWFDGRIAAQRHTQGNFDAEWLHAQTFALMKSRATYHRLPREALRFDTKAALAAAKVPVHIAEERALSQLILSTTL